MRLGKFRMAKFILLALALAAGLAWVKVPAQGAVSDGRGVTSVVVYSQPPDPVGGYYNASENGNDWDEFVWDNFTLTSSQAVTEIHWRGAYSYGTTYPYQPVLYFTVAIYPSTQGGLMPDYVNLPLVEYQVNGNAGETAAGTFGGLPMYDYTYTLPVPFPAAGGVKYWVYLEAYQAGVPDWCIARGSGGDNQHFHGIIHAYNFQPGDAAFTLLGPGGVLAKGYLPLVVK